MSKRTNYLDFLQDAVRFSYKVYGYCRSIKQYSDYDFIMGIDADSVFTNLQLGKRLSI